MFINCTSLEKVIIPKGVTSINTSAFSGCTGLKSITIPITVTGIEARAFEECSNLTEVTIPSSVTDVDSSIFDKCDNLVKVTNNSNVAVALYKYNDMVWYNINDTAKANPIKAIAKGTAIREDYKEKTPDPDPDGKKPSPTPDPVDPNATDPTKRFSDVPADKWYSKPNGPIAYVIANSIMSGTSGTAFNPDGNCTREMFVQILYNIEGKPIFGNYNPFSDVIDGSWYSRAVIWAYDNEITSGTSATTFGVGGNVTREQLAQFLMNYANKRGFDTTARVDISGFPDAAQVSGWAAQSVSWANANGIINGKARGGVNFLDPKGNATRAEVAMMIMGFQKKFGR